MVASIYTRTWRWDSRTGRLAVELRSILHPERGTGVDLMMERWDCGIVQVSCRRRDVMRQ